MYGDLLEKPEELCLYRGRKQGGLGLHHLKSKATAILIRSFLETAVNPKFLRNNFHYALFQWHVLGDTSLMNPGLPPYYSKSFFTLIREAMTEAMTDVGKISTSEWCSFILEKQVVS